MITHTVFQMIESATKHLQDGLHKGSVGIDFTTRKVKTGQKLVNSKFRYGALFQTQPLLDCLDHMSAEADQRRRSLSKAGAADLVASFLID